MNEVESNSIENTDAIQPSSEAPESSEKSLNVDSELTNKPENKPEPAPFHEHPRFKELVEQKNSALATQKALEQKLAQLEARFNQPVQSPLPAKAESEFESLIKDLKQVDPRLAAQLEAQAKAAKQVEELTKRLEGFEKTSAEKERASQVQTAVAKINQLHESNKVSPEVKNFINDKLDLLYMQGKLNLTNLDAEYKNAIEGINKYIDSVKRMERESYVADKKKDAAVPTSQPKGKLAVPPPKQASKYKDRESMLKDIQSDVLKQLKADRDAASA